MPVRVRRERLSKDVRCVFGAANLTEFDPVAMNFVANVVSDDVDMLSSRVENRIKLCQLRYCRCRCRITCSVLNVQASTPLNRSYRFETASVCLGRYGGVTLSLCFNCDMTSMCFEHNNHSFPVTSSSSTVLLLERIEVTTTGL